ncbi:241_t:CDS:2, partial [Acaulospora colombiana]
LLGNIPPELWSSSTTNSKGRDIAERRRYGSLSKPTPHGDRKSTEISFQVKGKRGMVRNVCGNVPTGGAAAGTGSDTIGGTERQLDGIRGTYGVFFENKLEF